MNVMKTMNVTNINESKIKFINAVNNNAARRRPFIW